MAVEIKKLYKEEEMNKDILEAVELIEKEKDIPKEILRTLCDL